MTRRALGDLAFMVRIVARVAAASLIVVCLVDVVLTRYSCDLDDPAAAKGCEIAQVSE